MKSTIYLLISSFLLLLLCITSLNHTLPQYQPQYNSNCNSQLNSCPITFNPLQTTPDDIPPPPPPGYELMPDSSTFEGKKFRSPASVRASMLKNGWDCPGALCTAGFNFIHSFPRVMGDNKYPDSLVVNYDFGSKDTRDYVIGVVSISFGLPILFLILFCFAWGCFACWRCCCNLCGGRIATRKYSTGRQWCCRIAIAIWGCCVLVCLGLAIGANHGISKGVDSSVNGIDGAFGFLDRTSNYLKGVTDPFESRVIILKQVYDILGQLPENPEDQRSCYEDSIPINPDDPLSPVQSNEQRMKQSIELQHHVQSMTTTIENLSTFEPAATTANLLEPAYTTIYNELLPYIDTTTQILNPTTSKTAWDDAATKTSTDLNGVQWDSLSGSQSTTFNFFSTNADFYAVIANTTTLAEATNLPGSGQFSSLQGARAAVDGIAKPFSVDLPLLISAFESQSITAQQCNTIAPQMDTFISSMLDFVELNRLATNNSIAIDLNQYQQSYINDEIETKWNFIKTQTDRFPTLRQLSTQYWTSFSSQTLIQRLIAMDSTNLRNTQKQLNSISTLLQQIIAALEAAGATNDITTLTTTTLTQQNTALSNDVLASTASPAQWAIASTTSEELQYVTSCLIFISSNLVVSDEWITSVENESKFLVQQNKMLVSLGADIKAAGSGPKLADSVRQDITQTLKSIGEGFATSTTTAANSLITSSSTSLSTSYVTQPHRQQLIDIANNLKQVTTTLQTLALDDILSFNSVAMTQSYDKLLDSGNTGIVTQLTNIGNAFKQMSTVSTNYATAASLLLENARNQLITYMSLAYRTLGTCSATISFQDNTSLPTATVANMLKSMRELITNARIPAPADVNAQLVIYDRALTSLSTYNTAILPTITTIQKSLQPYNTWIASNDVSSVNYKSTTSLTGTSSASTFVTSLASLQTPSNHITTNVVTVNNAISDKLAQLVTNYQDYKSFSSAVLSISTKHSYINSTTHITEEFPYIPFVMKDHPYLDPNLTASPPIIGTKLTVLGLIRLLADIRSQTYETVGSSANSVEERIEDVQTSMSKLDNSVEGWADTRTTIKRNGYMIDQERLIIIDVFLSIGIVMVVCLVIFAFFKMHKLTMVCTMLLCPFVILSFLLAAIHMSPSLLLADGCQDRQALISLALGNREISIDYTQGLVSYISQETAEPIRAIDLFEYSTQCDETKMPQLFHLLEETTPQSIPLQLDDLTAVERTINDTLARTGRTPSPRLHSTIESMGEISALLADFANGLFNEVLKCNNTQGVAQDILNRGVCDGVAKSGALLGGLLFLTAFCIFPGLIMGCGAFKVLNTRNHENYKKKFIKQQTDKGEVVYVHGYVEGEEEGGEIMHVKTETPVGLEDGISYNNLKGFKDLKKHPVQHEMEMAQF